MSVLAFITRGIAAGDTYLVTVRPTVACGVPWCICGFSVVGAPAALSTDASPCGEVDDDGKETGDLRVM